MKAELNENGQLVVTLSEHETLLTLAQPIDVRTGTTNPVLVGMAMIAVTPFVERDRGQERRPTEIDLTNEDAMADFAMRSILEAQERLAERPEPIKVGNPYTGRDGVRNI